MGGHGGLNILPQKSWNVYNFENREKVRRDEEAAAREEQLKQEQARKKDAEFRLEKLRQSSRGKRKSPPRFESPGKADLERTTVHTDTIESNDKLRSVTLGEDEKCKHINLFEGWDGFQMEGNDKDRKARDSTRNDNGRNRKDEFRHEKKRRKEEESVKVISPEDEKYRLGYGVAGKDVKKPWYLSKNIMADEELAEQINSNPRSDRNGEMKGKKKSLQELREERLKREQQERERTRKLLFSSTDESKQKLDVIGRNRAPFYNSGYNKTR